MRRGQKNGKNNDWKLTKFVYKNSNLCIQEAQQLNKPQADKPSSWNSPPWPSRTVYCHGYPHAFMNVPPLCTFLFQSFFSQWVYFKIPCNSSFFTIHSYRNFIHFFYRLLVKWLSNPITWLQYFHCLAKCLFLYISLAP